MWQSVTVRPHMQRSKHLSLEIISAVDRTCKLNLNSVKLCAWHCLLHPVKNWTLD